MNLEQELHDAMITMYQRAGEEVGYWGTRFLQAVRRNGGLATARRMLKPRTAGQRQGLDKLLEAGRPDLSLEAVVLDPKFRALFTPEELGEAEERLGSYRRQSAKRTRERLYPDELELGRRYPEGARKQVRVNRYERDEGARRACLAHHGTRCVVCGLSFLQRYGEVGRDFIHVHHVVPLSRAPDGYTVDPVEDLVPVCPNCHAMLHREDPPLRVEQLQELVRETPSE